MGLGGQKRRCETAGLWDGERNGVLKYVCTDTNTHKLSLHARLYWGRLRSMAAPSVISKHLSTYPLWGKFPSMRSTSATHQGRTLSATAPSPDDTHVQAASFTTLRIMVVTSTKCQRLARMTGPSVGLVGSVMRLAAPTGPKRAASASTHALLTRADR